MHSVYVVVGVSDLRQLKENFTDGRGKYPLQSYQIHPMYRFCSLNPYADIAVLELSKPIPEKLIGSGKARTICLPTSENMTLSQSLNIAGWGRDRRFSTFT